MRDASPSHAEPTIGRVCSFGPVRAQRFLRLARRGAGAGSRADRNRTQPRPGSRRFGGARAWLRGGQGAGLPAALARALLVAAGLAGCAVPWPLEEASDEGARFALPAALRAQAEPALAQAAPARTLRAYAVRVDTIGSAADTQVFVVGRLAWLADGSLASVTSSQSARAFGLARSLGLCGLVSLRLDTARAARAYLPADPARSEAALFTEEARLDIDTRLQTAALEIDGTPCAPQAGAAFAVAFRARRLSGAGAAPNTYRIRYACRVAPVAERAATLHPDLPGSMLRVECERYESPGGSAGRLVYAWIAASGVYLLVEHRGADLVQRYTYSDMVFGS